MVCFAGEKGDPAFAGDWSPVFFIKELFEIL